MSLAECAKSRSPCRHGRFRGHWPWNAERALPLEATWPKIPTGSHCETCAIHGYCTTLYHQAIDNFAIDILWYLVTCKSCLTLTKCCSGYGPPQSNASTNVATVFRLKRPSRQHKGSAKSGRPSFCQAHNPPLTWKPCTGWFQNVMHRYLIGTYRALHSTRIYKVCLCVCSSLSILRLKWNWLRPLRSLVVQICTAKDVISATMPQATESARGRFTAWHGQVIVVWTIVSTIHSVAESLMPFDMHCPEIAISACLALAPA